MKVAVGTVIYRNAWNWREAFLHSLLEQTDKDFELLVINDDIEETDLEYFADGYSKFLIDIIKGKEGATISENRIRLLSEARDRQYDLLILADFDDWFAGNRVEYTKNSYRSDICFYYHNLRLEHEPETCFANLPFDIDKIDELLEKNFLGLSNTAVNINLIEPDFITSLENVQTNVFDWYFFSRLLLGRKKGMQVQNTYTYYRQQRNHLAGIVHDDFDSLKREIKVKLHHYLLLKQYNSLYSELYDSYSRLDVLDESELRKYLIYDKSRMWWSNFQLRRDRHVYL